MFLKNTANPCEMLLSCCWLFLFFFVLCTVKHFFSLKLKSIDRSTIWQSSLYRGIQKRKVVKTCSEGWSLAGWMWKIRWIACLSNGLSVLGVCYAVLGRARLQSVLDNKTAPCTLFVEVASQRAAELSTNLRRRLRHCDVVCEKAVVSGK